METNSFTWQTEDDLRIQGIHWPVENPRAVICLAHGLGEHIHRYAHLAAFYNRAGIAVLGNDHRGHGHSDGKRGHAPDLDRLLDEIDHLISLATQWYPATPLFLFGQSMGGNLVLNYTLRRNPASVRGVIASSPWIQLDFRPNKLRVMAAKLMKNIYPTFTQPTPLNTQHLSTDPEVGFAYEADPLVHKKITAALGSEMLDAADYLHQYNGAFPIPLLVMQGTGDQIVSPEASREFAGRVRGDITFVPWEGLYHELHNEVKKEEAMETTLNWIEKKLNR